MTPDEIIALKSEPQNPKSELWRKAFATYMNGKVHPPSMNCMPCYKTVYEWHLFNYKEPESNT